MARGKLSRSRVSRSLKAGLTFPMSRVKRQLKTIIGKKMRISWAAAAYGTAVLEYLSAEILEISGNVARTFKQKRLNPRHIKLAVAHDEEMHNLLKTVTIPGGGVVPRIHPAMFKTAHDKATQDKAQKSNEFQPKPAPSNPDTQSTSTVKPKPIKQKGRAATKISKIVKINVPVQLTPKGKAGRKGGKGGKSDSKGQGITLLNQRILAGGQKLSVISGDIIDVACDVIINPSSSNYSLSGQVGSRLQAVGGAAFSNKTQDLNARNGSLATCTAAICDGVNFSAPLVMHCNGPSWSNADQSIPLLQTTVVNCLTTAETRNLKSICFPSIGSGVGNFPKQAAAQTILKSISDYFKANKSKLGEVFFILHDQESIDIYVTELGRLVE